MSEAEQQLARKAARELLPVDHQDPVAGRLVARGLLVDSEGVWRLNGRAWRDHVRSLG